MYTFVKDGIEYKLTDKERMLALCYVRNGFNATKAAQEVGYPPKTCHSTGSKILNKKHVKAFCEQIKDNLAAQVEVSAYDIAMELKKIGFSDIRKFYNSDGTLKEIYKIDDDTAASISDLEFGLTGVKIKRFNKIDALVKLARMLNVDGLASTLEQIKPQVELPEWITDQKSIDKSNE